MAARSLASTDSGARGSEQTAGTRDRARSTYAWRPAPHSANVSPSWEPTSSGLLWIPRRAGADAGATPTGPRSAQVEAPALAPSAPGPSALAGSAPGPAALEFDVELEDDDLDENADQDDGLTGAEIDGRYRILEQIGAGGIGVVYRARRLALDREVVVKFLRARFARRAEFVRRFEREALAMGRVHHAHCVTPIDVGTHAGRPYLVMEYVQGKLLSTVLRGRGIPGRRAIAIMAQILVALDHIHRRGIVHRDLKAGNIMLTRDSLGEERVKLLDFGMAKFLGEDEQSPPAGSASPRSALVSVDGVVVGTPSVMAPEQIRQLPLDGRADLYAAGVLMYQMVTGTKPFRHPDVETLLRMHLHDTPVPPRMSARAWATSTQLERAILCALAKDPCDRFASALEMRCALQHTPEARGNVAATGRSSRRSRRWKPTLHALAAHCRHYVTHAVRALVRAASRRLRSVRDRARARLCAAPAPGAPGDRARARAALTDGATSDYRADNIPRTPSR